MSATDLSPGAHGQTDHPARVSREDFIRGMRSVANAVSVVTTDGDAGRHGGTVSAFCSVSADPPTVLVCLKADSRIARLVKANGVFALNVLGAEQSPLATRFAGGEDASLCAVQGRTDGRCDRFADVALDLRCAQPMLIGATGFGCVVNQIHIAGSHAVCIGDVVSIAHGESQPLVYHGGTYHQLAPPNEETGRG